MSQNFSIKTYANRTILILVLLIFGFISSKALISIGVALLLFNLLASYKEHHFRFVKLSSLPILAVALVFVAYVLSILFSPNFVAALEQVWAKLPFLIVPISIAAVHELKQSMLHLLLSVLVFVICVSGLVVLINYYSNYEFLKEQISMGKHIPAPLNHIRYSLMVAFAACTSIYFLVFGSSLTKYDKQIFTFSSIFLFVLLHILAVRSGLLGFYITMVFLVIFIAKAKKIWWLPVLSFLLLGATVFLSYQSIASFKNKIDYMVYDIRQFNTGNQGHYSDGRRLKSLEVGWQLFQQQPILGYGAGNGENASINYYNLHYPQVEEQNQKVPHNQFLFTLVELGLFGLFFLIFGFFTPIFGSLFGRSNPLFISLWLIIFTSCWVDNTFESQVGMTFYLVFASLLLKWKQIDAT